MDGSPNNCGIIFELFSCDGARYVCFSFEEEFQRNSFHFQGIPSKRLVPLIIVAQILRRVVGCW